MPRQLSAWSDHGGCAPGSGTAARPRRSSPMRFTSTATQASSSSRHIRSTGPMSVGHSRRTSRRPSPQVSGASASAICRSRSTPSFSEPRRLSQVVGHVGDPLLDADLEPFLLVAGPLRDDDQLVGLLDPGRRGHPVLRLEAPSVGVDHHRPVGLQHEQAQGHRQHRRDATGVDDLAAGDDHTHDGDATRPPVRDTVAMAINPTHRIRIEYCVP